MLLVTSTNYGMLLALETDYQLPYRGERANGDHLREMQDKTKNIHEVETLYKLAFSLKGLVLKYAV
jgi:hypothetical protein